jgi:cell wall-associated NlpC family hydrolase
MLIQNMNDLQKMSHFVKTRCTKVFSSVMQRWYAVMLVLTTLVGLSSCQSTIRFSSKTSPNDAPLSTNYSYSSKSRASSTGSKAATTKAVYPPEHLTITQERLITTAERWLGTPYRYGATTRAGTDCSGFVMRIFEESGTGRLPRSTKDQYTIGTWVEREHLKTGDLLFFNTNGTGVSHVGLYVGQDSVIHASSTYGVVKQSFSETYLTRAFMGARRVLGVSGQ